VSLEDGQILSDSDDDAYGGTPSPMWEFSEVELGKADVFGIKGWMGASGR